jgi:Flp pilus assembly pilin Flp
MKTIREFGKEDAAATAMEYGLILGLLAAIVFIGITIFYQGLDNLFGAWGSWFGGRAGMVN